MIEVSRLRQLLSYDPATGAIIRLPRPEADFPSARIWRMWNRRFAGRSSPAKPRGDGYVMITVTDGGAKDFILAHRVAWALHHGCWPRAELDHCDGDHANNRIENLREASRQEQMQNMVARPLMGVAEDRRSGIVRYYASIRAYGRKVHLGLFDTPEAAHEAYLKAKRELHRFQPEPRDG